MQRFNSEIHYHIRWSDSVLDWKAFPTEEEATHLARQIKKPNETPLWSVMKNANGARRLNPTHHRQQHKHCVVLLQPCKTGDYAQHPAFTCPKLFCEVRD